MDPDQAQRYVGPDRCPNFLQKLMADGTIVGKELKTVFVYFWVLEIQKILVIIKALRVLVGTAALKRSNREVVS